MTMIKWFIIILTALLYVVTSIPIAERPSDQSEIDDNNEKANGSQGSVYRLPRTTAPLVYTIELEPNIDSDEFTFKGSASIIFEVLEPTRIVTLHRSYLIDLHKESIEIMTDGKYYEKYNPSLNAMHVDWNENNESYSITFEHELELGNHTLKLKWDGRNPTSVSSFSRLPYYLENDDKKYLLLMISQPMGARRTFPCWDEPGFKAQFKLSIKHSPSSIALSNMPIETVKELGDGNKITHFTMSPKMSTYALCMAVFENYDSIKSLGGNISFYALPKDLNLLGLPLHISEDLIGLMEFHADIPYALPKLDQIIIPYVPEKDTLENWGLLSYQLRTTKFRNTTLIPNVEDVDDTLLEVAHQIAYQWFGNLVTPAWWDDTWLTESFSSYYAFKLLEETDPFQPIMDRFVIEFVNENSFDAELLFDEPLSIKRMPVDDKDINNMIGPIAQYKGPGVLHMLDHILGKNVFRNGVRRYLKAHQFGNVVTDDLWKSLQEAYDKEYASENPLNIKETMDPWIEQSGTPVIIVTRDYETGETNITQRNTRFANSDNKWKIPINYATESDPDFSQTAPTMWMEREEVTKTIPDINKDDWIIVNIQQRGFYQVNYDKENWRRLAEYLVKDHKKIHPVNRAQLIEDAHRMYKDDNSYIEALFNISYYLHEETDYLPWIPVSKVILDLHEKVRNTDVEHFFNLYVLFITNDITDHIGFGKDTVDTTSSLRVRNMLAPIVCKYGHAECRSFAKEQFDLYMENPSKYAFPSSNWDWILCYGLREANDTVWNKFLSGQLSLPEDVNENRHKFVRCAETKEKRDQYIAKVISTNSNATTDQISNMFVTFLDNDKIDVNYAMQYFIDHFDDIESFLKKDEYDIDISFIFGRTIFAVKSQEQYDNIKAFFESKKDKLKKRFKSDFSDFEFVMEKTKDHIQETNRLTAKFRELLNRNFILDDSSSSEGN